jgi:hypothetical protein
MKTSVVDQASLLGRSAAGCAATAATLEEIDFSTFTSYEDLDAFLWERQRPVIFEILENDGLAAAVQLAGSERAPLVLSYGWQSAPVTELREALVYAWTMAHQPRHHLSYKSWTAMFKRAGYVAEGAWDEVAKASRPGRPKPTEPIIVWRGGTSPFGMSWTCERTVAEKFVSRIGNSSAALYGASVPPAAVLAQFDCRDEAEVVVNPAMLRGRFKWVDAGTGAC